MGLADAIAEIDRRAVDVAVPQLFCRTGMTHHRALLDLLGIPYVGNAANVMAVGADKARARAVVAAAGVRVPQGEVLARDELPTLGPPVVVKPVDADNSHGVTLVRRSEELPAALATAYEHADRVLVERYVELGREVRCGILQRGDELVVLPLEEYDVDPATRPIRTAADKLARTDEGELRLVAKGGHGAWVLDADDPLGAAVGAVARRCHLALGCRDYSLFDFRVDPAGEVFFLEASLYCSYAPTSVVAVMAAAAGIPVPELFGIGLDQALARRRKEDERCAPSR